MVVSVLITFISILLEILSLAIIARVLVSWINLRPDHPVVVFLHSITEPVIGPLRNVIPPIGMIDITPLAALILIQLVRSLVVPLLWSLA